MAQNGLTFLLHFSIRDLLSMCVKKLESNYIFSLLLEDNLTNYA